MHFHADERVRRRIRGLLAVAQGSPYQAEAATASRLARKLLRRYKLRVIDLTCSAPDPELWDAAGALLLQPAPSRVPGVELIKALRWAAEHGLLHRIVATGPLYGRLVVGPGRWEITRKYSEWDGRAIARESSGGPHYYLLPDGVAHDVEIRRADRRPEPDVVLYADQLTAQCGLVIPGLSRVPRFLHRAYAPRLRPFIALLKWAFPNARERGRQKQLALLEDTWRRIGGVPPGTCPFPVRTTDGFEWRWRPCGAPCANGEVYCQTHRQWGRFRQDYTLPGPRPVPMLLPR